MLLQRTWRGGCPSSSHTPDGALSSLLGREHLTRPAARRAGCAAAAAVACSGVTHAGCLASMMGTGLYAQRFAVGVLPPSSSRAAFASFSSRDRTTSSFEAAKRVSGRIGASTDVGELHRVVRDSHEDFNAVNVATAWSKLAKVTGRGEGQGLARSSDDIANTVQLLSKETLRVAGEMKPREVVSTLWGTVILAEKGVEVDLATMRAMIEQTPRVAGRMDTQAVSKTLWFLAKLADKGMDVDLAAVRAVYVQARRVAGRMNHPLDVSNTLWAIAKLAEKGLEVDAAAVQAVSEQAPRVAGEMEPLAVSNTLWAIAKLAEKGMEVDAAAVRAMSEQAPRVAGTMNSQNGA